MRLKLQGYGWPLLASLAFVALLVCFASIPRCDSVGLLLLPGALLAAVAFPQGPESDWAYVYLVLAGLIDWVLYAIPVTWLFRLLLRRRRRFSESALDNDQPRQQ